MYIPGPLILISIKFKVVQILVVYLLYTIHDKEVCENNVIWLVRECFRQTSDPPYDNIYILETYQMKQHWFYPDVFRVVGLVVY